MSENLKTSVRQIITLRWLKEFLPTNGDELREKVLEKIILIYSLPLDFAIHELERLSKENREMAGHAEGDIWNDFKNALVKMSSVERDRLRRECAKEVLDTLEKAP